MWKDKDLIKTIPMASSITETIKLLGYKRSSLRYRKLREDLERLGIDTSHFRKIRNYTDADIAQAAKKASSYSGVLRILDISVVGGSIDHYKKRIESAGIDVSHFKGCGWSRDVIRKRKTAEEILIVSSPGSRRTKRRLLKRAMLESNFVEQCESCSTLPTWMESPLVLDIDHKNGDPLDNKKDNLRFLCPNCHSQTKTYKNKKRG